jgi:endo-1,4-beta-xylanase
MGGRAFRLVESTIAAVGIERWRRVARAVRLATELTRAAHHRRGASLGLALALLTFAPATSSAAPKGDRSPPNVSIAKPTDGSRAWGITKIAANATDNRGVSRVDFFVDGQLKGSDSNSPYEYGWDTSSYLPGARPVLGARAYDRAGNSATSAAVTVVVARKLPLGSAVAYPFLFGGDSRYESTFLNRFHALTPERELKMDRLQPERGQFAWGEPDALVDYAIAHGKAVRGHVLVWGNGPLPAWLTGGSWTADELGTILKDHIQTVVRHYAGKIPQWDVVNEAFNSDGSYRSNVWYDTLGPSYVADSFRWAREADPTATLYYNEVSAERRNARSDAIYTRVKELVDAGVPIDGFGLQSHSGTLSTITEPELQSNMQRFADLGLELEITEMDVKTSGTIGTTGQKLQKQAEIYRIYSASCQVIVACERFTVWGVSDAVSWLGPAEMPLLFDINYDPKPAYYAVADQLAESAGPP